MTYKEAKKILMDCLEYDTENGGVIDRSGMVEFFEQNGYIYMQFGEIVIAEHRWVAEHYDEQGHQPVKGMQVHHLNRNRSDNRIENLAVYTPEQHYWRHQQENEAENVRNGRHPIGQPVTMESLEKEKDAISVMKLMSLHLQDKMNIRKYQD